MRRLFLSLLLLISMVKAADFHVDAAAKIAGDGRVEQPFRELTIAIAAAKSGDRILVQRGDYYENIIGEINHVQIIAVDEAVNIYGKNAAQPTLQISGNSEWRGFNFNAVADQFYLGELTNFRGTFTQCQFSGQREKKIGGRVLNIIDSAPTFNRCIFRDFDDAGYACKISANNPQTTTFTYCLFSGLTGGALSMAQHATIRVLNAVFAHNATVLNYEKNATATAEFINTIFYLNAAEQEFILPQPQQRLKLIHCCLTPSPDAFLLYRPSVLTTLSAQITNENTHIGVPHFAATPYHVWLNFGIDDASNVELWAKLSNEFSKYPLTLAINTQAMRDSDWQLVREQIANKNGEIAAHSHHHVPLSAENVLRLRYYAPQYQSANVKIANEILSLNADGKKIFAIDLRELSLAQLRDQLNAFGVTSELILPFFANLRARFLQPTNSLDVFFPHLVAQLTIDDRASARDEILTTRKIMDAQLPHYQCRVVVYPYTETSAEIQKFIRDSGYLAARAGGSSPFAPLNQQAINPFAIRGFTLKNLRRYTTELSPAQALALMLDYLGNFGAVLAFYAHTENEIKLSEWEELITALVPFTAKEKYQVVTLRAIAENVERITQTARADEQQLSTSNLAERFRLAPTSPLINAGKNSGQPVDFKGEPIAPHKAPNLGLFE